MSEELSALQQPPRDPRNLNLDQPLLDEAQEKWRNRSAAFGRLLLVANIDPNERPEWIKKEEVNYYLHIRTMSNYYYICLQVQKLLSECECFRHAFNSNPDVTEAILESAIELAWIMSTLLPHSSACKPTVYYPEWQELVASKARCDFLSTVLEVEQNAHAHNPGSALSFSICNRLPASIVMTR